MKGRKASKDKARKTDDHDAARAAVVGAAAEYDPPRKPSKSKVKSKAKGKTKAKSKARPVRRQIAALAYRVSPEGTREVLIITSRETRRFVIPKGWPMKKLKKPDVAATEAFEEAGVRGVVARKPIGRYTYWKRLKQTFTLIRVEVFPLEVQEDLAEWPERDQRHFSWLSPKDAAVLVDEPGLSKIIREFG